MKGKKRRPGKPQGMNYADVLRQRRDQLQAAMDATALANVNISMQRHLWLTVVSLHDAYGFSKKCIDRFFDAFEANSQELGRMREEVDDEYAFEKLRLAAEAVSGRKITYIEEGVLK